VCFRCGVEGNRAFECPSYNMQESKEGKQPRLKLVQVENEKKELNLKPHLIWGRVS
jgi:hypothetical protein